MPAKHVNIPFPVRGIDRSVPNAAQPVLTTQNAINVVPTPAISGRMGGGSRSALKKLFARAIAGQEADTRINHLDVVPAPVPPIVTDALNNVEIDYDFVTADIVTGGSATDPDTEKTVGGMLGAPRTSLAITHASYGTSDIPTSIGSDLAVFCRNEANAFKVDNYYGFHINTTTNDATPGDPMEDTDDGGLILSVAVSDHSGTKKARFPGVVVLYQTTNDMEVTLYAASSDPTVGGGGGNSGTAGQYNGIGPFIRGSRDVSSYFLATLEPAGTNAVKLVIWQIAANGSAVQVGPDSDSVFLRGSTWGLGDTQTAEGPTIRLRQEGEFIIATATWSTGFTTTAAGSTALDATLTTSYNAGAPAAVGSNATDPTNRAGVATYFATASADEVTVDSRYFIRRVKYTKRVPQGWVTMGSCDATSVNTKGGRYYLPTGSASAAVLTAGTVVNFGNVDANSDGLFDGIGDSTGPVSGSHNVPRIDSGFLSTECTRGVVQGMTATTRSSILNIQNANTGNSGRIHVEVRGRTLKIPALDDAAGVTAVEDIAGVALRLVISGGANNWESGLLIEWKHGAGDTDEDPYLSRGMQDAWDTIRVVGVANGARTVLKTFTVDGSGGSTAMHMPPFRGDTYQRWEDSGHALDSANLRFYWKVNGIVQLTINPNTDISGWATFIGTTLHVSDRIVLDTSKQVGLAFWPEALGTLDSYTFGGRVVNIDAELPTIQAIVESKSSLVAFTKGIVHVGDPENGTIVTVNGLGPRNPVVSSAALYNRLFAVDGGSSVYLEYPFTNGVKPWIATAGTLPEGCRHVAMFLGSVVLAAPRENPTHAFWSRLNNGFDYDFGADPVETSAFALANSRFGLPPEPIVSLMTAADDVLVFACANTMSAMVGDPRAGGSFVLASPGVGIVGPRAWCVDDQGVLWFVGIGGLYRMFRGSQPENVSRGRLGRDFDDIDSTNLFVQLDFDPVERRVYILLTDRSSYSEHFVYDVGTDSFFEARYDGDRSNANMAKINPWSTAVLTSSNPLYRRLIMGGGDGYIRVISDTLEHDDGVLGSQPIITDVDFPIPDNGGVMETMLEDLTIYGHLGSDPFTVYHKTGDSMQDVANDVASDDPTVTTITVTPAAKSYQTPVSVRRRGGAHKLRLYNATTDRTWGLERIVAKMSERGRRR